MTLDEIFAELAVPADASPDEVRRAYLRQLKVKKPETDPEGFRRLREAYELARLRVPSPAAPLPIAVAAEPSPAADAPPVEDHSAPSATGQIDDPASELWRRLETVQDPTLRVAALREVVDADPTHAPARWMLVQELVHAQRDDEAVAVLREGHALGIAGFRAELVLQYPATATASELAEEERGASPQLQLELAHAWMTRGDVARAAQLATDAIGAARASPTFALAAGVVIDLVLRLHATSGPAAAQVHDLCAAWLRETGQEVRLIGEHDAVAWGVARELRELAADPKESPLPIAIQARMIEAVRTGNPVDSQAAIQWWANNHPQAGENIAVRLQRRAPLLSGMFGDSLDPLGRRHVPPMPQVPTPRWALVAAAVMVVLLVALGVAYQLKLGVGSDEGKVPTLGVMMAQGSDVARATARADRICMRVRYGSLCAEARAAADALVGSDCPRALAAARRMRETQRGMGTFVDRDTREAFARVDEIEASVVQVCVGP